MNAHHHHYWPRCLNDPTIYPPFHPTPRTIEMLGVFFDLEKILANIQLSMLHNLTRCSNVTTIRPTSTFGECLVKCCIVLVELKIDEAGKPKIERKEQEQGKGLSRKKGCFPNIFVNSICKQQA